MNQKKSEQSVPFFYDVTLRDGNQALERPWTPEQKIQVFKLLQRLGVAGMEVGFPAASAMDFQVFEEIAGLAQGEVIGALARCDQNDIEIAVKALMAVKNGIPRLHTFIGMSPFHMESVLVKSPDEVRQKAIAMVAAARKLAGESAQIQFSPEHFGDCAENLDWVISVLKEIVAAGADVINLPNTVERTRPFQFCRMVKAVIEALPGAQIAVHCHNDLGMTTATTVESFFVGANQLEVTLNSLGERAGNASLYEVAMTLEQNGIATGLRLEHIYRTALEMAELSRIPIPPKAAIIGAECLCHRSGIHQAGATRTMERAKGAYRAFDPAVIGRAADEELRFTSQSGSRGVVAIVQESGLLMSTEDAEFLLPALKEASEHKGELPNEAVVAVYQQFLALKATKAMVDPEDARALVINIIHNWGRQIWKRGFVRAVAGAYPTATISLISYDREYTDVALGDGPVDASYKAIAKITGLPAIAKRYEINNVTGGADAQGKVICGLELNGDYQEGCGADTDIVVASVDAYLDALNRLLISQ